MKARLIKTKDNKLRILCEDGTLAICSGTLLYDFLTNFKISSFKRGTAGRWDIDYPDMSSYPGETMAHISDARQLVVYDITPFSFMLSETPDYIEYLSTEEYAKRHNVSPEMIKVYCRNNRVAGAKKVGSRWAIPATAPYPVENRKPTSGRYKYKK